MVSTVLDGGGLCLSCVHGGDLSFMLLGYHCADRHHSAWDMNSWLMSWRVNHEPPSRMNVHLWRTGIPDSGQP